MTNDGKPYAPSGAQTPEDACAIAWAREAYFDGGPGTASRGAVAFLTALFTELPERPRPWSL